MRAKINRAINKRFKTKAAVVNSIKLATAVVLQAVQSQIECGNETLGKLYKPRVCVVFTQP